MNQSKALENPIFIVGCPRSGTTLLQRMLDAHPEVAIAPETHFMQYFWNHRSSFGNLQEDENFRHLLNQLIAIPEFGEMGINTNQFVEIAWQKERTYQSLFEQLLQEFKTIKNVSVVGEKTPNHILFLTPLKEFFPKARFINIIRDPRGVVNSWRSVPWSSGKITQDAQRWRGHVVQALNCPQSLQSSLFTIFYETLLREPEKKLRSICHFLELEYSPIMLNYYQNSGDINLEREPWKKQSLNPIDLDRLNRWKNELSSQQIKDIEAVTWWEMKQLGYQGITPITQLVPAVMTQKGQQAWKRFFSKKQTDSAENNEGQKVVFISTWQSNPYKKLLATHLEEKGATVKEYRCKSVFFLPLALKDGQPDIVHFHTLERWLYSSNERYRKLKAFFFLKQINFLKGKGTKIVWTVHELHKKVGSIDEKIIDQQLARLGEYFDGIIAHSDSTKTEIIEILGEQKTVKVIPHGNYIGSYPNTISKSVARQKLNLSPSSIVFLVFGGLYRYKGVLEAIEAFQKVTMNQPTDLVIAGNPNETGLREEISSRITNCSTIHFIPERIPDEEIQIYFNACDCVLLPYQTFTTSGIALLAMSFARSCIAPRQGFFGDTLDDSGAILYENDEEQGLLKAMKKALENPEKLTQMGQYNLHLAQEWSWDWVAEQTLQVYFPSVR